jgi:hypothetical protein
MTFQFLCPQGHLLEGEESQMGQQCDCPMCGMRFIIPTVGGAAPAAPQGGYGAPEYGGGQYHQPAEGQPSYADPHYGGGQAEPSPGYDYSQSSAGPIDPFAAPQDESASPFDAAAEPVDTEPKILHIPCPAGHELETPPEMIGQDVLCPYCGVQFNLRYKDSTEYKAELAAERERKEEMAGKMWFQYAIIAAVVVLLGLVGMVVYTMQTAGK